MPVGPIGSVIYANQMIPVQASKQTEVQNALQMQSAVAAALQNEKEDEEATSPRKRGRKGNSKGHKELSLLTQFRCYLNISVKPLIPSSIDQRKLSLNDLTAAQKSFLSYFLASKTPDTQLL